MLKFMFYVYKYYNMKKKNIGVTSIIQSHRDALELSYLSISYICNSKIWTFLKEETLLLTILHIALIYEFPKVG